MKKKKLLVLLFAVSLVSAFLMLDSMARTFPELMNATSTDDSNDSVGWLLREDGSQKIHRSIISRSYSDFLTLMKEKSSKERQSAEVKDVAQKEKLTTVITTMGVTNRPGPTIIPQGITETDAFLDSEAANNIKIIKHYQMYDDVIDKILPVGTYLTSGATHDILVKDEQKINNFKLKEWFLTDSDDIDETFEILKENSNVFMEGWDEEYHLIIPEGTSQDINCLHILYEYEPIDTSINIYKLLLEDERLVDFIEEKYDNTFTGLYNATVDGYTCKNIRGYRDEVELPEGLLSHIDSSELSDFNAKDIDSYLPVDVDFKSIGISNKVAFDAEYPYVYMVYEKETISNFKLYSNELSHVYRLSQTTDIPVTVYYYIPSAIDGGAYAPHCNGHDDGGEKKTYCSVANNLKYLFDSRVTLSITDNFNYNETDNITDYRILNKENLTKTYSLDWSGNTGGSLKLYPDAEFILYRSKESDPLTLYPEKNNENLGILKKFGLEDVSYTPVVSRRVKESFSDSNFKSTLETHWETSEESDAEIGWYWRIATADDKYFEEKTGGYSVSYENGHSPEDINAKFNRQNNIITNYYRLRPNTIKSTGQMHAGKNVLYSKIAEYYPYYKMNFEYFDNKKQVVHDNAYITGDAKNELLMEGTYQVKGILRATFLKYLRQDAEFIVDLFLPCIDSSLKESIVNGIDITTNEIQSDEFIEKMMKHIGVNGKFVKMIRTMYKFNFTDNSSLIVTKNREVPVGVKELNYINRHTPIYDNLQKSLFSSETTLDRSNKVWLREMYDGVRLVHCRLIMK